jgi:pimeloyl-ACP methyl ester carboxylesterase
MAGYGEFVPSDPEGLGEGGTVPNAAEKVLVIFLHGSEGESVPDPCNPKGKWSTTPRIINDLSDEAVKDKQILVFSHCTSVPPAISSTSMISPADTKVVRRYQELGASLEHFTHAGYLKKNIFIAGHSAGAWIALWRLAEHPRAFAGAIAFAPAFAGKPGRPPGWDNLRMTATNGFARAAALPSLIYAFENDEWEPVNALEQIFAAIPGVSFVKKAGRKVRMLATSSPYFHCGAYGVTFAKEERGRILSFISDHL